MTADRAPESLLPLTAVAFEILMTLADSDSHGYHIMQEVERRTNGAITLHPGTLYRALARLLEQEVIDEVDEPSADSYTRERRGAWGSPRASAPGGVQGALPSKKEDVRRRYYRLTRFGRAVLVAEAARLEQQVREARARRLLGRQER